MRERIVGSRNVPAQNMPPGLKDCFELKTTEEKQIREKLSVLPLFA